MDELTHKMHQLFDENVNLTPEKFNELSSKNQYVQFNLLRYEIRSRVLPENSGGGIDAILKEIDEKLSDVLFG